MAKPSTAKLERLQKAYEKAVARGDLVRANELAAELRQFQQAIANQAREAAATDPAEAARLMDLFNQAVALQQGNRGAGGMSEAAAASEITIGQPDVVDTPREALMAWGVYAGLADKFIEYQGLVRGGMSHAEAMAQTGLKPEQVREWREVVSWSTERLVTEVLKKHGEAETPWQSEQYGWSGVADEGMARLNWMYEQYAASGLADPQMLEQWRAWRVEAGRLFEEWEAAHPGAPADAATIEQQAARNLGMSTAQYQQINETFHGEDSPFGTIQMRTIGRGAGTHGGGLFWESGVYSVDYTTGQTYSPSGEPMPASQFLTGATTTTGGAGTAAGTPTGTPAAGAGAETGAGAGTTGAGAGTPAGTTGGTPTGGTTPPAGGGEDYDPWWAAPWSTPPAATGGGTAGSPYSAELQADIAAAAATQATERTDVVAAQTARQAALATVDQLKKDKAAALASGNNALAQSISQQILAAREELASATANLQTQQTEWQAAVAATKSLTGAAKEFVDYQLEASLLMDWLPQGAANLFANYYAQYAGDADLALAAFRADPQYDTWFPGNKDPNGRLILSEEDFADTMTGYMLDLVEHNINPTLFYHRFPDLVQGHVSVAEFADRIQMYDEDLRQNIGGVRQWYAEQYGLGELTDEALLASMLDPKVGEDVLQRRISMAQIGGEGLARGLAATEPTIRRLLAVGFGQSQASDLFAKASYFLPKLGGAAGRARAGAFGLESYIGAEAFGDAAGVGLIQRLQARESALFSEASDVAGAETGILKGLREQ